MEILSSRSSSAAFAGGAPTDGPVCLPTTVAVQEGLLCPPTAKNTDYWRSGAGHPSVLQGWERRSLGRRRGAICDTDGSLKILMRLVVTKMQMEEAARRGGVHMPPQEKGYK